MVGSWRIMSYRSPALVDLGEVLQPAGLPCLKLALADAASGVLIGTRSYCGERGKGGLAGASLPVRTSEGRVFTVLFGEAPEQPAAVEIASSVGMRRRAGPQPRRPGWSGAGRTGGGPESEWI